MPYPYAKYFVAFVLVVILIGFWDEADLEDARAKGHSGS